MRFPIDSSPKDHLALLLITKEVAPSFGHLTSQDHEPKTWSLWKIGCFWQSSTLFHDHLSYLGSMT